MKKILIVLGLWLVLLSFPQIAEAQSQRNPCFYATSTSTGCTSVSGTNPLPVSASVSVSGFAPTTTGTPISVTTGGVTGSLPAGTVVVASNVGTTNTAYCKLGASATTSDQPLSPNGGWFAFTVGANTQLTCITSTSTTTVNMVGGSGLPTGTGGGGGGGGGAITAASGSYASGALSSGSIASGAMVDLGAQADAACGTASGTCSLIALTKYLNTSVNSGVGTPGSAVPSTGIYVGGNVAGNFRGWTGVNPSGSIYAQQVDIASVLGATMSATNGAYTNVLQGNAALSASNPLPVSIAASTTGGCTPNTVISSAASTNATNVKASAGTLCDWAASNTTTTTYWVHFYNNAGSPTCNASIIESYPIPPAPSAGQVGGWSRPLPQGHAYGTGIAICITANSDGTGSAATGVSLNIAYK